MAKAKYAAALKNVLVHEGGIVDHPADPGGLTNQGVTQRVYDLYRKARKLDQRTVRKMTTGERDAIYKQRYWDVVQGDRLPPGIDYVVFDGAVNAGPVQAVKWLQRGLGSRYTGKIDGMLGPSTLAAVEQHPNHDALIAAILERRMAFLKALKTWKTFGKGWSRRIAGVKAVGQAWAMGNVGPAVEYIAGGEAKANIEDAKKAPAKAPGDAVAGGGTVGTVLTQATDQLTPFGNLDFVATAITVLTVAGVVLTVGGIAYRMWAKRQAEKLADALDTVPA